MTDRDVNRPLKALAQRPEKLVGLCFVMKYDIRPFLEL